MRIVWIIFDELDYRLAFAERPASVRLPEFDRLRAQATFAAEAYPPSQMTLTSLPALLTGRLVARAQFGGNRELLLTFHRSAEAPAPWNREPTLVSRARSVSTGTAIIGWYHPYCRIFANQLTSCYWEGFAHEFFALEDTVGGAMWSQAEFVLDGILRFGHTRLLDLERASHLRRVRRLAAHHELLRHSTLALRDPALEVVVLHLLSPHPPAFFDRARSAFSVDGPASYLDGLGLADQTLGELRRALEAEGAWDKAAVLVSSDHAWRPGIWVREPDWTEEDQAHAGTVDYRVPFLLKMPYQDRPLVYEPAFNTVLSQELLLATLRGEVKTAEDAVHWLEVHRTIGRSPYIQNP